MAKTVVLLIPLCCSLSVITGCQKADNTERVIIEGAQNADNTVKVIVEGGGQFPKFLVGTWRKINSTGSSFLSRTAPYLRQ